LTSDEINIGHKQAPLEWVAPNSSTVLAVLNLAPKTGPSLRQLSSRLIRVEETPEIPERITRSPAARHRRWRLHDIDRAPRAARSIRSTFAECFALSSSCAFSFGA